MKKYFLISLLVSLVGGGLSAQAFTEVKGNWKGVLPLDATTTTRLHFGISKDINGIYSGIVNSLDTGDALYCSVSNNPPYVRFTLSGTPFYFEGNLNTNFTQIVGTWWSGTEPTPMTLDRSPSVDEFQARTYSSPSGALPYRLFIPTNHDAGDKLPLVLCLHGAGQRGTDNRLQLTWQSEALVFVFSENQAKQRCFMAAPQCPTTGNWSDSIRPAQLAGLIAALKAEFNIDADRVYVTGLSMGGNGTWEMLARYKTLFAAGIPMAGYLSGATAVDFVGMPIWNFHATNDTTIHVSNSQNLIAGIRNLGGTPIYTEYHAGNHAISSPAYATLPLFDWMMAQKRGSPTNAAPFVAIAAPTNQPSYETTNNVVSLAGIADDTTNIFQVTWANNRGGSGTAIGTNNWSVPAVNLQPGTNLITVQATGTSWVSGYGGFTTFSDTIKINIAEVPATNNAPQLQPITNRTVNVLQTLAFAVAASDPDPSITNLISDFESYGNGLTVMFQPPGYSGSTASFMDSAVPSSSAITSAFPAGNPLAGAKVVKATWAFHSSAVNPWVRFTTFNAPVLPNPVIDFDRRLQFDICPDKILNLAVACRETGNAVGTGIGSNGGTVGGIEWVGVNGTSSGTPIPTRSLPANTWTTISCDLRNESVANFAGGNGVLATGLGTLEHLALVGAGGNGTYNVYLDRFAVVKINRLTYSLEPGAPAGATINATNGIFTWTPSAAQGPATYPITVRVTDNGTPPLSDLEPFQVTVNRQTNSLITGVALTNGQFQMQIPVDPGVSYSIQASTNLIHWQTILLTNTSSSWLQFLDSTNLAINRRFYRVLSE